MKKMVSAAFDCSAGRLCFDVSVQKEAGTGRLTFFFKAGNDTIENFDLFHEGIIRVACDSEKTPRVFSVPSHDPTLRRDLTVFIHDFIAGYQ